MSFAQLVEEARHLRVEEMAELREVLDHELAEVARDQFRTGHLEAVKLFEDGLLPPPTSNVDELMHRLGS